jgi:hypothetical protein
LFCCQVMIQSVRFFRSTFNRVSIEWPPSLWDYRADVHSVKFPLGKEGYRAKGSQPSFSAGVVERYLSDISVVGIGKVGKGPCMEEISRFVADMIRQTEEDLAFQRRSETEDGWLQFLEGKLQAFKLVEGHLEELRRKRNQLH